MPKVSICIPTYNRKDFLKETIDSIFSQTYKDYEIIIVDDGSTDGTEEMIKNYDFPIIYQWQSNRGDAFSRNKLIDLANGKYISFVDSDDLLVPDALERMIQVMDKEKETVIVYGAYYRTDEKGKICGRCKRKLYSGNITKYLFQTILVHVTGSMFPAQILKESPRFDSSLHVCSDYALWLYLSTKYKFIALPDPTYLRRRHSTNLSKNTFENCLTEYQVVNRFYNEMGGRDYIPEKIAKKVLSKKKYRAGRYALKEGLYEKAYELLGQSFLKKPNLKSLMYLVKAKILKSMTGNEKKKCY